MKRFLPILVALAFCALVAPTVTSADQYGATPANVQAMQTLANNVAAGSNQVFTSFTFGRPKTLTLFLSAGAATTFTVTESDDGVTYYQATIADTATSANYTPAGAGTLAEMIAPAAYIQVKTSASVTVYIHAQASY